MSEKLISNKKKKSIAKKKPDAIYGNVLNYSAPLQAKYVAELNALVDRMTKITQEELVYAMEDDPHFATDEKIVSKADKLMAKITKRFNALFSESAEPLATNMVNRTDKASQVALKASLKQLSGGLSLKTDILNGSLKEIISASIAENVSLIKSISTEYLSGVQSAVMRSITTEQGLQTLVPYLEDQRGVTKRRAKNIALDQTRKAYNNINKGRMKAIGVEKYEWLHSGGSQKPRQEHIALSGQIFSFDDPPIIDSKTGERGIPGQAINCKCRMVPVISFDEGANDE